MLKLYYYPGACSLAPHLLLEWIGAPYELTRVKLGDPAYNAINPAGAVPALDTGEGWILTQAGAVLQYLARRFPEAKLGGDGSPREEAELDRWSHFITGDLHPAFFPLFSPQRYTTSQDKAAQEAVKSAAQLLAAKKLDLIEAHLAGKDNMFGERLSFLDAYVVPMFRWAQAMLPEKLDRHPNCKTLLERLQADPAAKKALADEGL
ncbi:glutathione S-transferase family protein [Methylocystis heyeri]|uniref:Glutathione S-transferase n=1 Tax=Methylocystis heyeri TaxID=391905 RepID=A0A6B8K845_9HYPH|nr:glutathione S-transferase C-terminal domain-containing protein [Methylocystis heyeri]QGM44384.1 glutathione S-transferase [Methylocystis heyeri]